MKLWQDLRRRHVFRLVGLYIVGAWIVIQVASTFFPAWGIPDTALRYLIIAAVLCFPIAVIFSWFYDITAEGIVRTARAGDTGDADYRLKRTDYLILASLAVISIVVVYNSATKVQESTIDLPAATEAAANSIAVLPFSNYDGNPDTKYFSDGVTEEILHRLSEFNALHVLARTSSFAFANSELTVPKISEILGVRYLLQGSVRRDLDQVRITAQLVNSAGVTIWSQSFDRKLEGIFAIQSDIANAVAKQLVAHIAPRPVNSARSTENMEAYQEYLVGREYLYRRSSGWSAPARKAFRRAIELDPGYAPPYAGLAVSIQIGLPDANEDLKFLYDEAVTNADKALALDPDLAEAHAARGLLYLDGQATDPLAAEASLRRALELDPSVANAYNWLASALAMQNRRDEGLAVRQQGLEIDPLNPIMNINLAGYYQELGRLADAEALLHRLLELPSPPELAYSSLFHLYVEFGRLSDAIRVLVKWQRTSPGAVDPELLYEVGDIWQILGLREDADRWYQRAADIDTLPTRILIRKAMLLKAFGEYDLLRAHMEFIDRNNPIDSALIPMPAVETLATVRIFAGQYAAGISLVNELLDVDDLRPQDGMQSATAVNLLHALAYAYRETGNAPQATEVLELAAAFVDAEMKKGNPASPAWLEQQALNLTMSGDLEGAAAALALAVDAGWRNYRLLAHDPRWRPLFGLPGLGPLLTSVEDDLDRQAAEIESLMVDLNL